MRKLLGAPRGATLFLLLLICLISSCNKSPLPKKEFKLTAKTFYRISPISPVPVNVNGVDYVGFAHFPGGGQGQATHMGQVTIYYNQLSYGLSPDAPPVGSLGAPITDVPGYQVTGGPLPLIQSEDFMQLADLSNQMNIPDQVFEHVINLVIYAKNGDALFTSAIEGTSSTFPLSAGIVGFKGKALILGGRGKLNKAVGEIDLAEAWPS